METNSAKDTIIAVTTELISNEHSDIKNITSRMIAERAEVGLGLINYHFGSKENLISICVQRIINNVIKGFHVSENYATDEERLTAWATYVFHFLYDHPGISRISILNDLEHYTDECNSVRTQQGFMNALNRNVRDEDRAFIAFVLTSAMQVAFLSGEYAKKILGYDFSNQHNRELYIKKLVHCLLGNQQENHCEKENEKNEW